jgi:hypothetical protein
MRAVKNDRFHLSGAGGQKPKSQRKGDWMTEQSKLDEAEAIFSGRLRGNQLMLSGRNLGLDEVRPLWQSSKMAGVTWLDLDDNRLGDEGVKELAECPHLYNVQYLNLNRNGVTDVGLKHLAASKRLPKLKRLHLKNNPISGEGVVALFNSNTLEDLAVFQVNDGWTCKKKEGWRYNPQA